MTYFTDGFTSATLAGAVAEAAAHDLRVNNFTFPGFPQITVSDPIDDVFNIALSWNASSESSVSFELTYTEAKIAAKIFKADEGLDRAIFKRVQSALSDLEYEYSEARNSEHRVKAVAP